MGMPVVSRVVAPESAPDVGKRLPIETVFIDDKGAPIDFPAPATPTDAGTVKQAAPVQDIASGAVAASIAAAFNDLLASLRAAGILKA